MTDSLPERLHKTKVNYHLLQIHFLISHSLSKARENLMIDKTVFGDL